MKIEYKCETISEAAAESLLRAGQRVHFRFHDILSPDELSDYSKADALCEQYGELPWISFGGNHKDPFDCRKLLQLPHVQTLNIFCDKLSNVEAIRDLEHIRLFRIGTYDIDYPTLLDGAHLRQIHTLHMSNTKKNNFDLSPISQMDRLADLDIAGHSKNLNAVAEVRSLRSLCLSRLSKAVRLPFIGRIVGLQKFGLDHGARENIDEIAHAELAEFQVGRVLGLKRLDSSSFPKLESFSIGYQNQIASLDFCSASSRLRRLSVAMLKNLQSLTGIRTLSALRHLQVVETPLAFEQFCALGFPASLELFDFWTGRRGDDDRIRTALDRMGYKDGSRLGLT